jgi:DNA-binding transcriptional MerR regulator
MTVLLREEDRIDRELPGLRATERMCAELFYCAKRAREYSADNNILRKILIDLGITGTTNEEIEKQIALLLPGSDVPTRVTFAHTATTILAHGESEERDRLLDKIIENIERNLESIMQSFALRIGRLEKRQDHIRRSIDDFFGDQ